MFDFNSDQFKSMIRMLLQWFFGTTAGTALLTALHIDLSDNFVMVIGGIIAGAGAWLWSQATHKSA